MGLEYHTDGGQRPLIRVAIADDHPVVRWGITQVLAAQCDMVLTGEASSTSELLELLNSHPSDVLILDVNLPGQTGLGALPDIFRLHPRLAVLMLSVDAPESVAAQAIRAGAAGYLTKATAQEQLMKAIRVVAKGGRHITPEVADALAAALQTDDLLAPEALLSTRELQVLRLFAAGRNVTGISLQTGLSVRTVSTYKTRVMEKLGITNNADLIAWAIQNNLRELADRAVL